MKLAKDAMDPLHFFFARCQLSCSHLVCGIQFLVALFPLGHRARGPHLSSPHSHTCHPTSTFPLLFPLHPCWLLSPKLETPLLCSPTKASPPNSPTSRRIRPARRLWSSIRPRSCGLGRQFARFGAPLIRFGTLFLFSLEYFGDSRPMSSDWRWCF